MYEIDFFVQEKSKNTLGNNGKKFSEGALPRNKISQKWPNFHYFWNCGNLMPKHKTKIDMGHISVMMIMCVKLEKNLRWYILEIFKMGKNSQNGHKMAKIEKCISFTQKIVL